MTLRPTASHAAELTVGLADHGRARPPAREGALTMEHAHDVAWPGAAGRHCHSRFYTVVGCRSLGIYTLTMMIVA
jgi:hypothetical protein